MVTGSTPIASAGQLGVLLADDDFDDVAEIVGAWAQRVRRFGSPGQAGGVPRIPRCGRPRGGGSPLGCVAV
jgi:hypothetical protein